MKRKARENRKRSTKAKEGMEMDRADDPGAINPFDSLRETVAQLGMAPAFPEMPRRTLADKGCAGPTAAHVIEEVHVPKNFAYISFTTGSTAFQNVIGVTAAEIPDRIEASRRALELAGISPGARMLVTYPPLILVFPKEALEQYGIAWSFLKRSSRDALLVALRDESPDLLLGESTFIKTALLDAEKLGLSDRLPRVERILVAGTPMDLELPQAARTILGAEVHDLYGCQEFGWLTLDGIPVRDDISLIPSPLGGDFHEILVGGLPMSDSFPVAGAGHIQNGAGKIITYRRVRTYPDFEVIVEATPLPDAGVLERVARTIIRTKARIVKCSPDLQTGAPRTILSLRPSVPARDVHLPPAAIEGPVKTRLFEVMAQAQIEYESKKTWDPTYTKRR